MGKSLGLWFLGGALAAVLLRRAGMPTGVIVLVLVLYATAGVAAILAGLISGMVEARETLKYLRRRGELGGFFYYLITRRMPKRLREDVEWWARLRKRLRCLAVMRVERLDAGMTCA